MLEVSLSGSVRKSVGKKDSKALRNQDLVPVVVYGAGKEHHLSMKQLDLHKLLFNPKVYLVKIDAEGQTIKAVVQAVQQHPLTERILHVDFIEVHDNRKVRMEIPVVLKGRAPGVTAGGKMNQVFRKLRVSAMITDLPDGIEVDVSGMALGDSIRISTVVLKGVEILQPADAVICAVKMARGAGEEAAAAEAAATPADGAAPVAGATPADGAKAGAAGAKGATGAAKTDAPPAAGDKGKKDKK